MLHDLKLGYSTIVFLGVAAAAYAEQQVTLQTGATIIGNVSMDGEKLVVEVDGAKINVPFRDVATVTSVATDLSNQSQRLLLKGLEAQLLYGGEENAIGLLAEAHRLVPDDPHVAFWYARGLANAGYGKGANDVFLPRQAAIAAAYPGLADRLAKQIEERLKTESLPAGLVKRLDQIAAAADRADPHLTELIPLAAYFRLVDQNNEAIANSAVRATCNGEKERLESFADGYHLFTFIRRSSNDDQPCRLEVSQTGLVGNTFEFRAASNGAEDAGVFRVKRLSEADRRPVVVEVVDANGEPLTGATVTFSAMNQRGNRDGLPSVKTSVAGRAEVLLYPSSYQCQVMLDGFNAGSQAVTVAEDEAEPIDVDVKLHRAISATVKVMWRAKLAFQPGGPEFQGDAVTTGEFELHTGAGRSSGNLVGPYGPSWVRLVQTGSAIELQFIEQMYFPQAASSATWVGLMEPAPTGPEGAKESTSTAADRFAEIDLATLDKMKDRLTLPRPNLGGMPGRRTPLSLPIEVGAIVVGKIHGRDPQTGRPALFEFKVLATELSAP